MEPIDPAFIRYIKLGAGGRWEAVSLEGGRIEWGAASDPHELALEGRWDEVRKHYLDGGTTPSSATGYTNDARHFYEAGSETLWITFARGRLWWCFAEPEKIWTGGDEQTHGTRHRRAIGGWRDHDRNGDILNVERLSTRLTCIGSYRRTSCWLNADQMRLCLRYINAAVDEDQLAAVEARRQFEKSILKLIQRLNWGDFEELVDLILARSGWDRGSKLGGVQKDVDLIVEQRLTGERMAVQVKSAADQAVVDRYTNRLAQRGAGERLMLVCHSPAGTLKANTLNGKSLELMIGDQVARHAVRAGLVEWILQRA